MKCREATKEDIEEIVDIHLTAFKGFFLSKLGPDFLRVLYESFIVIDSGICFVLEEKGDGRLAGFVSGSTDPHSFFRAALFRKWHRFAAASLGAIFRNPGPVGRRLARAVFYRGEAGETFEDSALLSSLAIRPDFSGRGGGRLLVNSFVSCARKHGSRSVYLTTDACRNDRVNEFYSKYGFALHSQISTPEDRKLNCYRMLLN